MHPYAHKLLQSLQKHILHDNSNVNDIETVDTLSGAMALHHHRQDGSKLSIKLKDEVENIVWNQN